ncbi:MAG TPA: LacI family DNA-binding transcriptional regulator [Chloroflexia bacterium]|nr:LacI family DNA-binding transcriptional regulator [Chloroflexia bacterium]
MPASKTRPKSAVTAVEVARRAGVSIATVSRVLHQTVPVSDAVAERVRAAVAELGYVPQTAARNLALGKTTTLGLLLPEIGAGFFSPMLRGIESAARESGYDLLIATQHPADARRALRRPLGAHNTDGLLIFTDNVDAAELGRLHRQGFPVVLLYRSPAAGLPIPYVVVENRAGARQVVDHLIDAHGRRRIAFLRGPAGNEDAYWREQGYRESLAAHSIPFDPDLVADGEFQEQTARAAVAHWLATGRELDAIFAGDDDSAGGALIALWQAGKRVPQDVALAGFDDTLMSRYLTPPLTTVHAPTERVGQEAVRQLVRLITTGHAEPRVLLPTELVIRQSCGCP